MPKCEGKRQAWNRFVWWFYLDSVAHNPLSQQTEVSFRERAYRNIYNSLNARSTYPLNQYFSIALSAGLFLTAEIVLDDRAFLDTFYFIFGSFQGTCVTLGKVHEKSLNFLMPSASQWGVPTELNNVCSYPLVHGKCSILSITWYPILSSLGADRDRHFYQQFSFRFRFMSLIVYQLYLIPRFYSFPNVCL